jgi:hypothetical protein
MSETPAKRRKAKAPKVAPTWRLTPAETLREFARKRENTRKGKRGDNQ